MSKKLFEHFSQKESDKIESELRITQERHSFFVDKISQSLYNSFIIISIRDSIIVRFVYFIAETKGSMKTLQLKEIETRKINYAKKHFAALDTTNIKYDVITTYADLREKVL